MTLAAWNVKENVLQGPELPGPHHSSDPLPPCTPSGPCSPAAALHFLRHQHTGQQTTPSPWNPQFLPAWLISSPLSNLCSNFIF